MRVLVVDDSSTMRRVVTDTLARLGQQDFVEAASEIDAAMA